MVAAEEGTRLSSLVPDVPLEVEYGSYNVSGMGLRYFGISIGGTWLRCWIAYETSMVRSGH